LTKENLHGTGCVLSAAIAANLANRQDLLSAVVLAKEFVSAAIAGGVRSGQGLSSVEPLTTLYTSDERWNLFQRVSEAIQIMKNERVGRLIPEVQSNLGVGLMRAQSQEDVIAFAGRIIKNGDEVVTLSPPSFGGSKHVANIVLTAMRHDPSMRAAMNIKCDEGVLKACRKLKFSMASFDRAKEPKKVRSLEGSSLEWGTDSAIRKFGSVPDIIYDLGGMGKEEMVRVLAEDIETLTEKVLKIHRYYK